MADIRAFDVEDGKPKKVSLKRFDLGEGEYLKALATVPVDASGKMPGDVGYTGPIVQANVTSFPALDKDTDSVSTEPIPASSLDDGVTNVTTAGTPVALASSTPVKWVVVQAREDNTSKIAIGGADVDATITTGTGVLLSSEDSICIEVDNLADVYIDSRVNGEGVTYTYGV